MDKYALLFFQPTGDLDSAFSNLTAPRIFYIQQLQKWTAKGL